MGWGAAGQEKRTVFWEVTEAKMQILQVLPWRWSMLRRGAGGWDDCLQEVTVKIL